MGFLEGLAVAMDDIPYKIFALFVLVVCLKLGHIFFNETLHVSQYLEDIEV